jgi:uncharacterized protein (TIGR00725 family)
MPAPSTYVAVIGPGTTATAEHLAAADEVGAELARAGAVVLTGGHGGVMQAAAAGARSAGGTSIGILPEGDRARANPDSTFTIPTGLGELRNGLLVRAADAVICVALSWGTLSEVALAVRTGVPVVMLGGWDGALEGPASAATPREAVATAMALVRPPSHTSQDADVATVRVHHVTLTVTDVDRSAAWYQQLLGPAEALRREGPGWSRIRLQWPGGLVIGVTGHHGTPSGDRFDHGRVGMDHVGLGCAGEAQVRAWAQRLDAIGAPRGPVEDVPYGWAVTGRDPDGIPVEFFAPR